MSRVRKLGHRQIQTLFDAAYEVATACPWVWIDHAERSQVNSLAARGLVGMTENVFGIMPAGCLVLRHYDRALARKAINGLRREQRAGGVMPWHV